MIETILRKANQEDAKLIFDWANDEEVRQNAINKDKIKWEDHLNWFKKKIQSKDTYLFVLEYEKKPIGQIRFDRIKDFFEIDYSIDKLYRRKGLGQKILTLGLQELYSKEGTETLIKAKVLNDNIGSHKVFKKIGFQINHKNNDISLVEYVLRWPISTNIILSSKSWNKNTVEYLKNQLPGYKWVSISKKEDLNRDYLNSLNPNKIFIPHWSYIIPEDIFSNFECIVFHMTDLPYGRGGSPLQNLIVRGHKETKISALKVVKELDAGPIYIKKNLSLLGTAEEIFLRANTIIEEMIRDILLNDLKPIEQIGNSFNFKRRTPEMSNIEKIIELDQLYDHIRMMDAEGYPKAYLETEFFKFEFSRASLKADETIIADVRIIKK